jgi:hypothetical protein
MPLDPSLIIQPRRVAQLSPDEAQANALKLSQMQMAMDEQRSQLQDKRTISDLYRNNIDANGNINAAGITRGLATAGMGDRIPEFQTKQAEYGKAVAGMNAQQLEFHKKQLDAVNGSLASLLAKPDLSHDDVINEISGMVDNGIIDNASGAKMVQQLPGPDQLRGWLTQRAIEGMDQSKKLESVLPKYDEQDRGGVINQGTINPITGQRTAGVDVPKTMTPDATANQQRLKTNSFGGQEGDLLAALAEQGVSLPAGMRSKEQQLATVRSLLARNPGLSADEIAYKVGTGQIGFGVDKKETQTAAGISGKIRYAENEIQNVTPLIREASAQVPRGAFVPWNKLSQMADTSISDPNLKQLKSYLNTLSNAYDMLAARGGTDQEKRAHNRAMFDSADSPEALEAALQAVEKEAALSDKAGVASTSRRSPPPTTAPASDVPPDIAALLKKHGGS